MVWVKRSWVADEGVGTAAQAQRSVILMEILMPWTLGLIEAQVAAVINALFHYGPLPQSGPSCSQGRVLQQTM